MSGRYLPPDWAGAVRAGWCVGGTYRWAGRALYGRTPVSLHPLVRLDLRQRVAPLRIYDQHAPDQVLALYKNKKHH